MKRKFAFHPKEYAIGQTEKFYTDMAAKGWHLDHHGPFFSDFIKGEPKDMKYRVEVISPKAFDGFVVPDEQLAVYEDCGWEYVHGWRYIHIFRAPAGSDTEEFYLDPAQQAATLKGLRQDTIGRAIYIPVFILMMTFVNSMMGTNVLANTYRAWISLTWLMIGATLIMVTFFAGAAIGAFHLSRLYRKMKKGIPLDHSPKNRSKLPTIIKYSMYTLGIAIMVFSANSGKPAPMPAVSDGAYVTFSELGTEAPRDVNYYGRESEVTFYSTPFCVWWEAFEVLEKSSTWMYQDIYLLKDEKLADNTAKALMNTSTFAQSEDKFTEMEFAGLDKVYYNADLELVVINNNYVGYFTSIFTEESRTRLLTHLAEKWI